MGLSLVKVVPAYMSGRWTWLIIMRSGAWRERVIVVSEFRQGRILQGLATAQTPVSSRGNSRAQHA